MTTEPLKPRVLEGDVERRAAPQNTPRVLESERTDRVVATQPTPRALIKAEPRRSRALSLGAAGLGVFVAGWFIIDAYWWIAAAFDRSTGLGMLAATTVAAGVIGASAIIARELKSLWRLRNVETIRKRFDAEVISPVDARRTLADILAVIPRERETQGAIEIFQRQVQPHHNVSQQVEILSRTVMRTLDARAEEHVRAAVFRAFGITAISPTALSDAVFFVAVGVRMVRQIAAAYGHRPAVATTAHLLRRLVIEAGKLGVVDIASTSLAQQLGGAFAERVASTAADAFYASYRMARLGVLVMDMCRPIPFSAEETPSITAMVSNVIRQRTGQAP
jgi:putative membrane protein